MNMPPHEEDIATSISTFVMLTHSGIDSHDFAKECPPAEEVPKRSEDEEATDSYPTNGTNSINDSANHEKPSPFLDVLIHIEDGLAQAMRGTYSLRPAMWNGIGS